MVGQTGPTPNHVAQMQLRHFIVGQVQGVETRCNKALLQFICLRTVANLNAHKNIRFGGIRHSVVELSHIGGTQQVAKLSEAAAFFRHCDRKNRFTLLTHLSAFSHKSQAIEVHVGATRNCDQCLVLQTHFRSILFQASHSQCTCGFKNTASVLKNVFDCSAGFVGGHPHNAVHILFAQSECFFAHQFYCGAIREQTHFRQGDAFVLFHALRHGIGVHGLYTNNFDVRTQLFHIGTYASCQPTPADRDENGVYRALMLTQNFHAHGALARNYIRVVKGVYKGQAFGLCQF